MARKLHRRSSQRHFFPDKEKGGSFETVYKTGKGIRDRIEETRNGLFDGVYNGADAVPHHRADEVLRLAEAGFGDDEIAEFLLIPVEEIEIIIREDEKREEKARSAIRALFTEL